MCASMPAPELRAQTAAGWHTLLEMIPAAIDGQDPQWSKQRWDEVHASYERELA